MSSSTIDEAVRLLELGYGDTERLKKIIETFNKTSMISMYDRKYIESLVTTYLIGTRRSPDKLPSENKNDLESARKPSKTIESMSTICDNCNSEIGKSFKFCPSCGKPVSEISEQVEETYTEKTETEDKVTPTKLGINLSISEIDAVRRHFQQCWNIPSGAREAGNLATEIKVRFNKEGNVVDARIVDISRMKRDRYFRTAAESALRAVLNPRCKNAPLPENKFDKWKNLTLNFDPKNTNFLIAFIFLVTNLSGMVLYKFAIFFIVCLFDKTPFKISSLFIISI